MKDILKTIIVTVVAGVIVAYIIQDARFKPPEPPESPIDPTSPTSQTQPMLTALSESFDGADSSYDSNLWNCENECGIDNLFLKNGALSLQRNQEGWTGLSSRSSWTYNSLVSLEGNMSISDPAGHPNAWLAIATAGCLIFGTESPYIQCSIGPVGSWEYSTDQKFIEFDKWYKIKIVFNQESNKIEYFLDNRLIGEYSPDAIPNSNSIYLGIYSEIDGANSLIHIDNVILTVNNK
jgi:hypothetical protein